MTTARSNPEVHGGELRRLLSRHGSYPLIAAAAASGRLPDFPVTLFDHIGDVYRRVETAAGDEFVHVAHLRVAALLHEEPPASLSNLLDSASLPDFAPLVQAVIGGFGRIWKVRTDDDLRAYVEAGTPYLTALLLFEVAHEGRPTVSIERAARLGGLQGELESWLARLRSCPARSSTSIVRAGA